MIKINDKSMTLDLSILREILIYIQENNTGKGLENKFNKDTLTPKNLKMHVLYLYESNFITGEAKPTGTEFINKINHLTPKGHEAAELVKDEKRWEKIEAKVNEKPGAIPFEIVLEILRDEVKRELIDPSDDE